MSVMTINCFNDTIRNVVREWNSRFCNVYDTQTTNKENLLDFIVYLMQKYDFV
jgi:hypothetical protein